MKKEYETPKAEKMVFDYTDTIVTSPIVPTKKGHNPNCAVTPGPQSRINGKPCSGGGTKNKKC